MPRNFQSNGINGFTLIELILVILILGIITAGASTLLQQGFRAFVTGQNMIDAQWQARVAFERLARDLHAISTPTAIDPFNSNSTQIVFFDIKGDIITYNKNGTQLLRNGQALADGIQALIFNYYYSDGTMISPLNSTSISETSYIETQLNFTYKNTNLNLTNVVYLWNQ